MRSVSDVTAQFYLLLIRGRKFNLMGLHPEHKISFLLIYTYLTAYNFVMLILDWLSYGLNFNVNIVCAHNLYRTNSFAVCGATQKRYSKILPLSTLSINDMKQSVKMSYCKLLRCVVFTWCAWTVLVLRISRDFVMSFLQIVLCFLANAEWTITVCCVCVTVFYSWILPGACSLEAA